MILDLTAREREVLELAHLTAAEAGHRLGLSRKTVDAHRAKAVEHLGAESWPDAVRRYTEWKVRAELERPRRRRRVVPQAEDLGLVR